MIRYTAIIKFFNNSSDKLTPLLLILVLYSYDNDVVNNPYLKVVAKILLTDNIKINFKHVYQ